MTLAAKSIASLAIMALLVQSVMAQNPIPQPGAPASGYYIEFSDKTTGPADVPRGVSPSVWQSAPAATRVTTPVGLQASLQSGLQPGLPTSLSTGTASSCDHCDGLWDGACDSAGGTCDGHCESPCTSCGVWVHRVSAYVSGLYLRPRNADVAYAAPIDGPITPGPGNTPLQAGGIGVVDPDYQTGYDFGVNLAITPVTSVYGKLMMLDFSTSNQIATAAPNVMRSLVSHPSSTSAATDFLSASANLGIELETVDLGLKHLFVGGQVYAINYFAGARYSRLEQTFGATFVDNGTEQVATGIDFDGAGLSLGLEAERQSCTSCWRIYTRGSASFLAGQFRGRYFQGQSFDPVVVDTSWEAGRIVPVLDLELGTGWTSPGGCLRLSAGYVVSAWFNTVTTEDFIGAVQANNFADLGDTLTFDGLRAQAEWRF